VGEHDDHAGGPARLLQVIGSSLRSPEARSSEYAR
jgi:hypothetical protein